VAFGQFLSDPAEPRVQFFLPYTPECTGALRSGHGWAVPLVAVLEDIAPEDIIQAARRVGGRFGLAGVLTRAARDWTRSAAYRSQNPHRLADEQLDVPRTPRR